MFYFNSIVNKLKFYANIKTQKKYTYANTIFIDTNTRFIQIRYLQFYTNQNCLRFLYRSDISQQI